MKSDSLRLILAVIGTLVLAGCHKLEATTKIEPNGSGELRMGIGFSADERANMEKQNSNPQDFCNTSQAPANVTVTEEQRGEETWCFTTTQFKDLEELRGLYGQRDGIRVNRLEITDDRFYYDVDIDTLSEDSAFSALTEIKWSVVLPGEPISSNADQVDGNTLTWLPTPKSGIIRMQAESQVPRGFSIPPCGTALIALGVTFNYVRRQRGNSRT